MRGVRVCVCEEVCVFEEGYVCEGGMREREGRDTE
jgi:hypothetical protein